ncbi:MAG: hypothetical protein V3R64_09705, partial [Sphingomonadales bacterium]
MTNDITLDPNLTQQQLMEKAEAGHAFAQYTIAKQKQVQGDEAETLKWMRKSAEGELFLAEFEMGMWHLLGHLVEFDQKKALTLIGKAVDQKFSDAIRLMAVLHGMGFAVEKNWEKAVDFIIEAAELECPHTLRQIAFLLMREKGMKELCEKLINRAASFDELVCLTYLGKKPGEVKAEEIPEGWSEWKKVREKLLKINGPTEFSAKELNADPAIRIVENALTTEECLYLRTLAGPALTPNVQLMGGNPNDPKYKELQNNSLMVFYPIIQDLFTIQMTKRLAAFAEATTENTELPVVQKYAVGQEFKEHADYMDPDNPQQAFAIQQAGQRTKSIFVYLNDDYDGGETAFPKVDLQFKGKEGDALVLDNMDTIGLPNEKSLHAG